MAWGESNSLIRQGDVYSNKSGAAKVVPGPSSFNGSNKIATLQELLDNYNISYSCAANGNLCPKFSDITFNDIPWQTGLQLYLAAADHYGSSTTTWVNKAATGSANNFTLNSFVFSSSNGWLLSGNQKALVNATVGDGGSSGYTGVRWASSNFIHSATQGTIIFNWYNGYGYSGYQNNKFILGNQTVAMSNGTILFEQFAKSSEITFYHRQNGTEYSLTTSGAGLQFSGETSKTYACIAFVYNGPVWTIYVNGVQRATGSSFPNITNNSSYKWNLFSLESGRYSSSGAISHLLVYNRAMTLAQTEEVRNNIILASAVVDNNISVTPGYANLDADGMDYGINYGLVGYEVNASGSWTVTKPSWIFINPTSGSAGTTLVSISGSINRFSSPRTGRIVFTCGTATATVYVEQDGTTT